MRAIQQQSLQSDEDRARVLTKAVRRVADYLSLTHRDLAQILGTSEATVSRLAQGRVIPYPSKESELAALLVRLYRSLDAIVGGRPEKAQRWFRAENTHLNGIPATRIRSVEGLVDVLHYLDAMRGKL